MRWRSKNRSRRGRIGDRLRLSIDRAGCGSNNQESGLSGVWQVVDLIIPGCGSSGDVWQVVDLIIPDQGIFVIALFQGKLIFIYI